jgi:hypothetical protein
MLRGLRCCWFTFVIAYGCDFTCPFTATIAVITTEGKPVGGATITELDQCCYQDLCDRVTTDDGLATFSGEGIDSGTCEIRIEKAGFRTVTQKFIFVCATGRADVYVPITLSPL